MKILTLKVKGFRSFQEEEITFHPSLTILVGENNVGKSAIAMAIERLFSQIDDGNDKITRNDYPYNEAQPLSLELVLELSQEELETYIVQPLMNQAPGFDSNNKALVRDWLHQQGNQFVLLLQRPQETRVPLVVWGKLLFLGQFFTYDNKDMLFDGQIQGSSYLDLFNYIVAQQNPELESGKFMINFQFSILFRPLVTQLLRRVVEFRDEATVGDRTTNTETMTGSDTASVLLNLKNHWQRSEQRRYQQIANAFTKLFNRYNIEAVEPSPGSGQADIQFYEEGRDSPLALEQVSAGVKQVLTLLTNLIDRHDLIIFIEHPEQHLHPHGMRFLQSLIIDASRRNQIIVSTHDPHFVDRRVLEGLHRIWWTKGTGSKVFGLEQAMAHLETEQEKKQRAQIDTVFRHLGNREMVFARAVLLVEDESQKEFLIPVAETLGKDIDSAGVSVISVGDENGYPPFWSLLGALAIPYICLKDKAWGDDVRYPRDRYFSFGMEIEDYLDAHGLREIRQEIMVEYGVKQKGEGKRRVMAILGAQVTKEQIPPIFSEILQRVIAIATGEPGKSD